MIISELPKKYKSSLESGKNEKNEKKKENKICNLQNE